MSQIPRSTCTSIRALMAIALALAIALSAGGADARPGKGGSYGSRGGRTYQAPPSTNTVPSTISPMDRSATPLRSRGHNVRACPRRQRSQVVFSRAAVFCRV